MELLGAPACLHPALVGAGPSLPGGLLYRALGMSPCSLCQVFPAVGIAFSLRDGCGEGSLGSLVPAGVGCPRDEDRAVPRNTACLASAVPRG